MAIVQRVRDRVRALRGRRERLVITYEPSRDGDADPGEVVWGWVPYEEDANQGKDRPVLVVGRWGADVACIPLTSKQHQDDPDFVPIGTGAWDPEFRPSWVRLDRVLRFTPGAVRREGCAIDERKFGAVVDALRRRQSRQPGSRGR